MKNIVLFTLLSQGVSNNAESYGGDTYISYDGDIYIMYG